MRLFTTATQLLTPAVVINILVKDDRSRATKLGFIESVHET